MTQPLFTLLAGASLAGALLAPFLVGNQAPFTGHMLAHMTLVAIAAPLLVLAAPRGFRRLARAPLLAAALEFAVVWAWHLPVLHAASGTFPAVLLLQQSMFLIAGMAVWAGALRTPEPLSGAFALFLTAMHMTALGVLLVLAVSPLYGTSLADQQLGGMLMIAIGTPVYLIGGLWLTARALDDDKPGLPGRNWSGTRTSEAGRGQHL